MKQEKHELVQADTEITQGGIEYVDIGRLEAVYIANVVASFAYEQGIPGLWLSSLGKEKTQRQFVPVQNGQPIIFGSFRYDASAAFAVTDANLPEKDFKGISGAKRKVTLVSTPSRDQVRTILYFEKGMLTVEQISSNDSDATTEIIVKNSRR